MHSHRSPRRALLAALALVAPLALLPAARADTLTATLGHPLVEVSHDVEITVEDGVARYRVQRVFANRGSVADEASLDIDLPFGGGVTGLRIKARDQWYDGDLMEAEAAAKLYEKLTGFGPFPAKDPALMQWVWPDKVHLQVFPVLPGQGQDQGRTSTVEYTITAPTGYRSGRHLLSYPRHPGPGLKSPSIVVKPVADPGAGARARTESAGAPALRIDGQAVTPGQPFQLPPPEADQGAEARWEGGVERAPGASYVFSRVEVPDTERARGPIRSASLDLALTHTFRGDLRVELVTPNGKSVALHDRAGGGENDMRGRFPLQLPPGTAAVGPWRLVISDHAARDVGTLDRWSLTLDTGRGAPIVVGAAGPLFIPDAPEGAEDRGLLAIDLAAPAIDTVAARLGRVVASPAHGFLRLELDAAAMLRPLPRRASVVFVVDASHTEGEEGIAAQLAVARAYLSHVPDASFEVVLFRRFAARLGGKFEPAARWDERIASASRAGRLAPGNGSALDRGLATALQALAGRPGPRRVVLLSDAELRTSFAVSDVVSSLAKLPADTVVHVVLPAAGHHDEVGERRDDDHALAPIAAAGRGILVHLDGVRGDTEVKRLAPAVLGLVRPIRIDHFRVAGLDDKSAADDDGRTVLDEGTSRRLMVEAPSPPEQVALEGRIWAEPFRRVVRVSKPFSKATAAFVFAEDRHGHLDHDEMMAVAMLGQVVSPVTSYIAVEPGVRPSTIGLLRGARGVGYGAGVGRLGGRAHGGGGIPARPDLRALVAPGVERCVAAHRPTAPWSVALDVETTRDEVVDVAPRDAAALGTPAKLLACVVEAAWAVRLDAAFASYDRQQYALEFSSVAAPR